MTYPDNFSRKELIRSITATNRGIDNSPPNDEVEGNLIRLANTLQRLRHAIFMRTGIHRAVSVSSGFRCQELNTLITNNPGSRSRHIQGLAADITVEGWSSYKTATFIMDNIPDLSFHKIINEYGRWVHISIPKNSEPPLRKFITAKKVGGATRWYWGIVDV